MTTERKPIAVLYIPNENTFGRTISASDLMRGFNGSDDRIVMPAGFSDYLWFVFVDQELRTPEIQVFNVKDYTQAEYDELKKMVEAGIQTIENQ